MAVNMAYICAKSQIWDESPQNDPALTESEEVVFIGRKVGETL